MGDGKTTERQRALESRMTALEVEAKALNLRLDELSDQLAMIVHHLQKLTEGPSTVSHRTH